MHAARARFVLAIAAIAALVGGVVFATPVAASALTPTPGWLHTKGAQLKTASNKTYVIKSVAWFGMELKECVPDGLWQISLDKGMAEIKSMGFNTIRLPFSTQCLHSSSISSVDYSQNPTLFGDSPLQVMDAVVARAQAYGLNVILDRHRITSGGQTPLWYTAQYSEATWIADWKMLAARYKNSSNVIGFDLDNEPHGAALWGKGGKKRDWQAAATRAGNAVLSVNPKLLVIVEGVAGKVTGFNTSWGGNLTGVAKKPVKLKVKNHVVYSPHDYPPSVNGQAFFAKNNKAAKLLKVWTASWGFITKKKIAPVLLGEFGSKLATSADKTWMSAMVAYLKKSGTSFSYWSFNPNSNATKGMIGDDWVTPVAARLAVLKPVLGAPTTVPVLVDSEAFSAAAPTGPIPSGNAAVWLGGKAWSTGYVAQVAVSSETGLGSWSITIPDPYATGVGEQWGVSCSVQQGVSVTCSGSDWGTSIGAGKRIVVGLVVNSIKPPTNPTIPVSGS